MSRLSSFLLLSGLFIFVSGNRIQRTRNPSILSDDPDSENWDEQPKHLLAQVDPSAPAISLTVEPEFKGAELFFDGRSFSMPRPITVKSHRLKGGVNWTIYPGSNYTGLPLCLISDPGHPSTSDPHMVVTVGSIRRGCWCNDSMMVTPKPRLSGTTLSGIQFWSGRNAGGTSAYTDGRETRFPYPIEMRSFQLMGRWTQWTLYANPLDVNADERCLVSEGEGGGSNYAFTNIPRVFKLSAFQQGCFASTSFEFAGVDDEDMEVKEDEASSRNIPESGGQQQSGVGDNGSEKHKGSGNKAESIGALTSLTLGILLVGMRGVASTNA